MTNMEINIGLQVSKETLVNEDFKQLIFALATGGDSRTDYYAMSTQVP